MSQSHTQIIPVWYVPSWYGDIKLSTMGTRTLVTVERLMPTEVLALEQLRKRALSPGWRQDPWATEESFPHLTDTSATTIELTAPIEKVQAVLVRAMKPGRTIVSAVRFRDGSVEEFRESRDEDKDKPVTPYRTPAPQLANPDQVAELKVELVETPTMENTKEATAAVSVAKPTIGCPLPDFEQADVKATRVLETFLDAQQLNDYRKDNSFITIGGDTHHRYLVCSRFASKRVKAVTRGWQILDLDDDRTICCHDWTLPAAEELLTLHLFLSMPNREEYVRGLH